MEQKLILLSHYLAHVNDTRGDHIFDFNTLNWF